jgi:DNA-binding CsgD family transcriptional regulator
MFPQKAQIAGQAGSKTYPLGEPRDSLPDDQSMALVALSHTPVEHRIYVSMLAETLTQDSRTALFSTKRLMAMTNIRSSGTVRRGLEGLIAKLSIERQVDGLKVNGEARRRYFVRDPQQILAQRNAMGVRAFLTEAAIKEGNHYLERAVQRVVANNNLSRREAQVALCCVEGLTNAQIGGRLNVREQTVKFHLRHVFIKFGVRRRAELISRLLM